MKQLQYRQYYLVISKFSHANINDLAKYYIQNGPQKSKDYFRIDFTSFMLTSLFYKTHQNRTLLTLVSCFRTRPWPGGEYNFSSAKAVFVFIVFHLHRSKGYLLGTLMTVSKYIIHKLEVKI